MTSPNIYQRRNQAKKQVAGYTFSKVKTQGLKYAYMPVEQMKAAVEEAWNDAGIVFDVLDTTVRDIREPWEQSSEYGSKSTWFHIEIELRFALVNMDDPADRVEMTILGEGKDNSDKARSKAYTAAIKNFLKLEYNIVESPKDDPDALQTDADIEASNARKKVRKDSFFTQARPAVRETPQTADTRARIDEITRWITDGDMTVTGIVGRYTAQGPLVTLDDATVARCYDECRKARGVQ